MAPFQLWIYTPFCFLHIAPNGFISIIISVISVSAGSVSVGTEKIKALTSVFALLIISVKRRKDLVE